jgi:ribosomal protein L37AE/L43A
VVEEKPKVKAGELLTYLSLVISITSGLLTIVEYFTNLGIMTWLYPIMSKSDAILVLLLVSVAFFVAYAVEAIRRTKTKPFIATVRDRPAISPTMEPYTGSTYGVKWRLYPPEPLSFNKRAWADGPFCRNCERELEERTIGRIVKSRIWYCPNCDKEFPRPEGDTKDDVEKDFEAFLRRKGAL